ncbi:NUDIX domain-containing protein [Simiduia curdlanivorans]|uniref:NUDIX domain-containing protein n=1 Tax=Simiduia curdlanivorans TaxID=1492769 RepID=A0ABV8V7U5_9GAMM|nr:NUDIX domain-containing protein [Simiduia curdlanivorans]MDN3639707.1 NUDIX domain-containing protein [Simiduia curdlanivorans]
MLDQWQPSACLIALRASADHQGYEVLLAKRAEGLSLAPGHHVFPGGALEPADGDAQASDHSTFKRAALREFNEEVCHRSPLSVALDELQFLGEWRAPTFLKKRYLTRFYVAALEPKAIQCDGREIVSAQWYKPNQAVNLHAQGRLRLMFPTLAILDWLTMFSDLKAVQAKLGVRALKTVCPVLKAEAGRRYLTIGAASGYRIERWRVD